MSVVADAGGLGTKGFRKSSQVYVSSFTIGMTTGDVDGGGGLGKSLIRSTMVSMEVVLFELGA